MQAQTIVFALSAALNLAEKLLPILAELFKKGQVSIGEQADLRNRYLALRNAAETNFTGPEWKVD